MKKLINKAKELTTTYLPYVKQTSLDVHKMMSRYVMNFYLFVLFVSVILLFGWLACGMLLGVYLGWEDYKQSKIEAMLIKALEEGKTVQIVAKDKEEK